MLYFVIMYYEATLKRSQDKTDSTAGQDIDYVGHCVHTHQHKSTTQLHESFSSSFQKHVSS